MFLVNARPPYDSDREEVVEQCLDLANQIVAGFQGSGYIWKKSGDLFIAISVSPDPDNGPENACRLWQEWRTKEGMSAAAWSGGPNPKDWIKL